MDFLQGAQGIASVARWFVGAALALAVVPVLADVAVGILAARHARRGGEGTISPTTRRTIGGTRPRPDDGK